MKKIALWVLVYPLAAIIAIVVSIGAVAQGFDGLSFLIQMGVYLWPIAVAIPVGISIARSLPEPKRLPTLIAITAAGALATVIWIGWFCPRVGDYGVDRPNSNAERR